MTTIFRKLAPGISDRLILALRLDHDFEVVSSDDEGRDITYRGRAGDVLMFEQLYDRWSVCDVKSADDADELYPAIGSAAGGG